MHSLKANWLNEMEKLWVQRRTKGFLLLTLLIPAAAAAAMALLQRSAGFGLELGGDVPMLMLGLFTTLFLPLFLMMTAVDLFTGEAAARTLKLALVRPITRAKLFASKVLALAAYIAVHLAAVWLTSVAAGLLLNGPGMLGRLAGSALAYAVAFAPMFAIGLIAVLIAQRFTSSAGALGLMIFVFAAAKLLPYVLPEAAVWSVFSHTDWHTLWVGDGASAGKRLNTFFILVSYSMMAYMGSLMMFERKPF
ncbi:ABC transporter permease [Paenibacillus arenilitoris]|uniref:ABC transporter permease n=1 Tax=Paenibacillus arenilitoris TaxID=2772299 RepID=A0A927CJS4_9BACL|nr:ABC transporter permease subunit [Paenibacillus arenilitoris]MBD2867176.1 ABC transporter permease [Paenibacillus arenilitoris]